jgi:hypothetical protein
VTGRLLNPGLRLLQELIMEKKVMQEDIKGPFAIPALVALDADPGLSEVEDVA